MQPTEGEWRGRGGHHSVPTKLWLLILELLDPTKSKMKVLLSVSVGVSCCFIIWIHQMIPLAMMIATLDLRWVIIFLTGISPYVHRRGECCIFPKYTHCVCWWRLVISAGGLSSACQFQYNPRKLTRGKLLMKHMYKILFTWYTDFIRHLGLGEQSSNATSLSQVTRSWIITSIIWFHAWPWNQKCNICVT